MAKAKTKRKKATARKRKTPSSKKIPSNLIPKPNLLEYLEDRVEKLQDEEQTADPTRREALKLVIEEVKDIEDDVEACFEGGGIPKSPSSGRG